MIHYNLLKFKPGADIHAAFEKCRSVYAALEAELPFLHDARVSRCVTVRDSNADIMMVMRIDRPEQLSCLSRAIPSTSRWRRAEGRRRRPHVVRRGSER